MKRLLVAVVFAAVAAPLFAGLSAKYRDWGSSPQAFYMTRSERTQWDALSTDAEAQAFIDQFIAKRGPNFAAEVADRAARADQYFTIGKVKGSQTMRGKVIILLGPPSGMDITTRNDENVQRDNPEMSSALSLGASSGGGAGSGRGAGDGTSGSSLSGGNSMVSVRSVRQYHFTYMTPKLDVIVPADPNTGRDLPLKRADQNALEAAFEAAAAASIKR